MRIKVYLAFIAGLLILLFVNSESFASEKSGAIDTLKILTYNVRNCKGMDNVTDYERVARVISRINADVVAIQELDSATVRSNGKDVLAELAKKTGMFPTYNSSIKFQGGAYGIGFLTLEKPISSEALPLPGSEEKRSVLLVEMKNYLVCCSHFSLTQHDRGESVNIINHLVSKYEKPVFLAGDLNAEANSPEILKLSGDWQILNDHFYPTFPANKPVECIDFIMSKKTERFQFKVIESSVEDEPVASDHLPVWVKVVVISN
ncbi:MAG TPA: metallophosphoesterase [Prolixibacteraceae bacterium]|nr:metallophosphoesterase [Prolixibacteraceae bacterium]